MGLTLEEKRDKKPKGGNGQMLEKFWSFKFKGIRFYILPAIIATLFFLAGKNAFNDYIDQKITEGYILAVKHSVERGSEFRILQLQYLKYLAAANREGSQQ